MSIAEWLLILTVVGGLYMAWNIGANDVANAMGTSVGSGALTLKGAIVVAAVFEFAGAVLVGSTVTDTIRRGILDTSLFEAAGPLGSEGPLILALGMFSALLAAGIWLQIATMWGLPVSTTHSIVGAVVGFGLVVLGFAAVDWGSVGMIALSWVVSPLCGALLGWGMFAFVRRAILTRADPAEAARRIGPWLVGLVATILVLSFIYKALNNVLRDPPLVLAWGSAVGLGVLFALGTAWALGKRPQVQPNPYLYVERVFKWLQIATAIFVAFAHGANDVANAVGPVAAVVNIVGSGFAELPHRVPVPAWILVMGGIGIVVGLATWGYKVIETIGKQITEMTPSRGFSAEFGAATTVLLASVLGLPISTTHTLVGAVIGVGLAQGMAALNMRVVGKIVNSWLATLPAAAGLTALLFVIFRALFL
ncbi:MAG TPA: anion permease [Longimicrobiaceae bacterium]|nr:anion permease [Longimicrobiaceae bacterium]